MAELHRAAHEARLAIGEVRSESKLQNWTWVAILVILGILGIALGVTGSYFFYPATWAGSTTGSTASSSRSRRRLHRRREAAGGEGGQGQKGH